MTEQSNVLRESRPPKIISLYTGVGGLDLGFEAAGFTTAVAVEKDQEAVTTLRHNRDWPVLDRDIRNASSKKLLASGSLEVGEAEVLIGGPPCQPFSKSGYWVSGDTLRLEDPRAGTLGSYLRVLRDTLPQCFLLENVPGFAYRQKNEGIEFIKKSLKRINKQFGTKYSVVVKKINAANYGVPQIRERVFLVGDRDGREFDLPPPTHGNVRNGVLPIGLRPYTTAWDAIGDLEDDDNPELQIRGRWAELIPSIPEGENYLWHTDRGEGLPLFGWRRRYWSFLLKLAKRLPSWTVQAQPGPAMGPFHWKNRRLSARELCRLQTLPDDFAIVGNLSSVQRQVGNAVPSALAEVLGRAIRSQFLGQPIEIEANLAPVPRLPLPPPEIPGPVAEKYLCLMGKHEAHPGTGKGYAALRRKDLTDAAP